MNRESVGMPLNRQILDEAADWFVEINEGAPDRATRDRFDQWLRASPEHVRAYLRLVPVWEQGASSQAHLDKDAEGLIAWAKAGSNVVPLGGPRAERSPRQADGRRSYGRILVAASVSGIAAAVAAWWLVGSRGAYETATGEQRLIALDDGSRIELNSRSHVRVRFTDGERDVDLMEGQALFRVAKDAKRPFVVHSGSTSVRALGTEFDVYKKNNGTVVTVVEGSVSVATLLAASAPRVEAISSQVPSLLVSAGEQTVVTSQAASHPTQANVTAATAWTQQRLVFSRTPLTEVAVEFNRYNRRRLIVKSPGLEDFKVSGSFSSADPASLVRFLRVQPGVRVDETADAIIVSAQ